jgi:hypothetical protein
VTLIAGLETTNGGTSLRRPSGNQALIWEVYENTDLVYKNHRRDFPITAIGSSTRIFHRQTGKILYGRVPAGSVVVPGSLPASDGSCHLSCAVIVKQVDAKTRAKTSINELLRSD